MAKTGYRTAPYDSALSGITVVDFTQFLAGPYGTQILANLGAKVVKVEPPDGDLTRHLPPYYVDGVSAYYLAVNRGKTVRTIDLKTEAGREEALALIDTADVVIENFRPGTLDRLGIRPTQIHEDRPGLIWCSISGFGQVGSSTARPAYDMVIQAMSGGMSITGEPDGRPVRAGIPIADLGGGLFAVIGILAALLNRNNTEPMHLDISMYDCQLSMLSYQAAYNLIGGHEPQPQGSSHDSIPTYRTFRCSDGRDIVVTANTDRMWMALCDAVGEPELPSDPRFATYDLRNANRAELVEILDRCFLQHTRDEWERRLSAVGVPCGPVRSVSEALSDPIVAERGIITEGHSPEGTVFRTVGSPILRLVSQATATSVARLFDPAIWQQRGGYVRSSEEST